MNITTRFTEEMVSLAKSYCDDPEETAAPEGGGNSAEYAMIFPPQAVGFPRIDIRDDHQRVGGYDVISGYRRH
jgi:hypothetical protein